MADGSTRPNAIPQPPSMYGPDNDTADDLRIYRQRPGIVQGLDFRPGSLEATIFWNAPSNMNGVDGWRIFRDNEKNLIQQIADRSTRQTVVKIPANTKVYFYVAAFSRFGLEGPKRGVLVHSNSDQLVVSGTGGATPGSPSAPDPGWTKQQGGGRYNVL